MSEGIVKLVPVGPTDPTEELGITGLRQYGGYIDEEFLWQLKPPRGLQTYREMRDNDPVVGAILFAIEYLVRQVEWRVVPASDSAQDEEIAQFVDQCFSDLSDTWDNVLSEILAFLWAGFSVVEEVYKRRRGPSMDLDPSKSSKYNDGRIGWAKLAPRAPETVERWLFDDPTGDMVGLVQRAPPDFRERIIPRTRFLHFRPTSHKGNPQGRSLLRNAYRPWFYKSKIETIEAIGVERDLAGLPVAFVPPKLLSSTATDEQLALRRELERVIRNIRRDEKEGVLFPLSYDTDGNLQYDFKLLSSGGARQMDTNTIINRYDRRIAGTVLADFMMLGQAGQTGTFALSESKTELFAVAIGGFLDGIVEEFNRFGIPRLLQLNAFRFEEAPRLEHGDIESIDLEKLGAYIERLANVGLDLTDEPTEAWLRMQGGLPESDGTGRGPVIRDPENPTDDDDPPPAPPPPQDGPPADPPQEPPA